MPNNDHNPLNIQHTVFSDSTSARFGATTSVGIGTRSRILNSPELPSIVVLVLLVAIGALQNANLLSGPTWSNIGTTSSYLVIVACGEGLILIAGGIDLSVGASFLAGAMTGATLSHLGYDPGISIIGGVLAGLGIGDCKWRPYRLRSDVTNHHHPRHSLCDYWSGFHNLWRLLDRAIVWSSFGSVGSGATFDVPRFVFYALAVALIAHVVLQHTAIGIRLRSIGGNKEAALGLGIPVRRLTMSVYIVSGSLAALAGILQASNLGAASPSSGTDLELNVIAAVIVGGVSVYGAVGSVMGMVTGAVLLSSLSIVLVLLHVSGTMQPCVVGFILIGAVALDAIRRRRMFHLAIRGRARASSTTNADTSTNRNFSNGLIRCASLKEGAQMHVRTIILRVTAVLLTVLVTAVYSGGVNRGERLLPCHRNRRQRRRSRASGKSIPSSRMRFIESGHGVQGSCLCLSLQAHRRWHGGVLTSAADLIDR